ncbi:MAG: HAD hydrolase-like protein [Aeromicrobium sp.]|uniref:HAD-IIA family hydrolase n=1 Tax=Aeromicrobium sp. TaxID=1871063 RepID=UPI0039E29CAC
MEPGTALQSCTSPLAVSYDAVMMDLDGVVYIGPHAADHAVTVIADLEVPVIYLTNNASRPASEVADHLRSFGLTLDDAAVVTAGQVVASLVAETVGTGAPVLLAGADGLRDALEARGLRVVRSAGDGPRAVVQGGVVDVRWSELAEASYAVAAGVPWFASNPDTTFPTPDGLAPGNGAFVQAVALAVEGAEPVIAGKPYAPIYDEATRRSGAARPLMVGDRIDTDIDGATAAGIDSLAVLTGVTSLADLMGLPRGHRPSYVGFDLRALNAVHLPVTITGDEARCGAASVRASGGVIAVPRSLDELRAGVALAWHRADRGAELSVADGKMTP